MVKSLQLILEISVFYKFFMNEKFVGCFDFRFINCRFVIIEDIDNEYVQF